MKLAIILTDPIAIFEAKGEFRRRYYNPANLFSEIHFLSPSPEDRVSPGLRHAVGNAAVFVHPVGPFLRPAWWLGRGRVGQLLRAIQPDVVRAYDPGIRGTVAVLWGRRLGRPVVLSVHADLDEQRVIERRGVHYLRILFERFALPRADRVICVTRHVADYAERRGARSPTVVYNRVYLDQFSRDPGAKVSALPTILSIGRFARQKYQECLIRATAGLDARLVLIGDGPLREEMQRLANEVAPGKVEFIRAVPNEDIGDFYHAADVFAIATHYEGFCIPVLEAMASGLPVVASEVGAIEELLGDAGRIVQNDPEAFRTALQSLLSDPDKAAKLGARALQRARSLDGDEMEQREAAVYLGALGKSSTP